MKAKVRPLFGAKTPISKYAQTTKHIVLLDHSLDLRGRIWHPNVVGRQGKRGCSSRVLRAREPRASARGTQGVLSCAQGKRLRQAALDRRNRSQRGDFDAVARGVQAERENAPARRECLLRAKAPDDAQSRAPAALPDRSRTSPARGNHLGEQGLQRLLKRRFGAHLHERLKQLGRHNRVGIFLKHVQRGHVPHRPAPP